MGSRRMVLPAWAAAPPPPWPGAALEVQGVLPTGGPSCAPPGGQAATSWRTAFILVLHLGPPPEGTCRAVPACGSGRWMRTLGRPALQLGPPALTPLCVPTSACDWGPSVFGVGFPAQQLPGGIGA